MTVDQYKQAVKRACEFDSREIGIWWNLEFMNRLEKEGLKLKPLSSSPKAPKHHYIQAPIPSPKGPISWGPSWIVER